MAGDGWDDDDPTIVRDTAFDDAQITPVEIPRCVDCGRAVFEDTFAPIGSIIAEGIFHEDRCVRGERWRWCCELRQYVVKVPR